MNKNNVQSIYQLTGTQSALLYHCVQPNQPDPGFLQVRFCLSGKLDQPSLAAAWQLVSDRHESMRMSLQTLKNKKQVLVTRAACQANVSWHDLRETSPSDQQSWLANFCEKDAATGLDLSESPVSRLTAIRTADDAYECVWSCHHLLLDGWSAIVILRDLFSLYQSERNSVATELNQIPSYGEYLAWHKLQSDAVSSAYWTSYLSGFSNPNSLAPLKRESSDDRHPKQVIYSAELPADFGAPLERAANEIQVTPAAVVYATWSLVLSVVGGVDDIVFGTTDAGRSFDLPERESMAGNFSNVIPLRTAVSDNQTFSELAKALHQANFGQPHNHYPLGDIQLCSELSGGQNLFETLLVYENLPSQDLHVDVDGGLTLTNFSGGITTTFPLTLVIKPGETWAIDCTFTNQLSADKIKTLLAAFVDGLCEVCANPSSSVSQIRERLTEKLPFEATTTSCDAGETDQPVTLASTQIELEIAKIWGELLGVQNIDVHAEFNHLGGRSIAAVRMVAMIEDRLGQRITFADLVERPTIAGIAALLENGSQDRRWTSLLPIQPLGDKPPLFSVHAGGVHSLFLRSLIPHMESDQPIFGFQSVGLDGECAPMNSMQEIAQHYLAEMLTVQSDGPYFLAGHCAGARVVLEMAQQLKQQGKQVALLVILDSVAPSMTQRVSLAKRKTGKVLQQWNNFKRGHWGEIVRFFSRGIVNQCKSLNRRRVLAYGSAYAKRAVYSHEVKKAIGVANWNYVASDYDGDIVLIRSQTSDWKRLNWSDVSDHVQYVDLPISHITMFLEPDVQLLSSTLTRLIHEAQEKRANSANKSLELNSSS